MLEGNLLAVSATDRDKLKPLEDSLYKGLSLRQMIFLLTDKQGVTPITVPVSGDARAPTFGLDIDMDAAVDKALKQVTAFVVAPVITATVQAVNKRRKRIVAVPFAYGSASLADDTDALVERAAVQFAAHPERMATVLYTLMETVRHLAILVQPVVPGSAEKMLDQLAVPADARRFANLNADNRLVPGTALAKPEPVFPRYVDPDK